MCVHTCVRVCVSGLVGGYVSGCFSHYVHGSIHGGSEHGTSIYDVVVCACVFCAHGKQATMKKRQQDKESTGKWW